METEQVEAKEVTSTPSEREDGSSQDDSVHRYTNKCQELFIDPRKDFLKALRSGQGHKVTGSADVSAKDALALCKGLTNNRHITLVKLYSNQIGDQAARGLGECLKENKTIRRLYLRQNRIGPTGCARLAEGVALNSSLVELSILENPIGNDGTKALAKALASNSVLSKLTLTSDDIGDDGVIELANMLRTNRTLNKLALENNSIGVPGATALSQALEQRNVSVELTVFDNLLTDEGVATLAKQLATQSSINFSTTQIGCQGAEAMANVLSSCDPHWLSSIVLDHNRIASRGAMALAQCFPVLTSLEEIVLNDNCIGDTGAEAIALASAEHPSLKRVLLGNNLIGDQGAVALAEALKSNAVLTTINLERNSVTEDGQRTLVKLLSEQGASGQLDVSRQGEMHSASAIIAGPPKPNQSPVSFLSPPPPRQLHAQQKPITKLFIIVKVIGARNLPVDIGGGKSSPYVNVTLGEHIHTTRICESREEVSWNETFTFDAQTNDLSEEYLTFKVLDYEMMKHNDVLGEASLNLSHIQAHHATDLWLSLSRNNDKGEINVEVTLVVTQKGMSPSLSSGPPSIVSSPVALTQTELPHSNAGAHSGADKSSAGGRGDTWRDPTPSSCEDEDGHQHHHQVDSTGATFASSSRAVRSRVHAQYLQDCNRLGHAYNESFWSVLDELLALPDDADGVELRFRNFNLGPLELKALEPLLPLRTNVSGLDIEGNAVGDDGIVRVSSFISKCQNLQFLSLKSVTCSSRGIGALSEALKSNSTLTDIDLEGMQLRDDGVQTLAAALKQNHVIQSLKLEANGIGVAGAASLGETLSANKGVTELHLDDNPLGDDGLAALLAGLKSNSSVRHISLKSVALSADAGVLLADFLNTNGNVWSLLLDGNVLEDRGTVRVVQAVKNHKQLQFLSMRGADMTPANNRDARLILRGHHTLRDLLLDDVENTNGVEPFSSVTSPKFQPASGSVPPSPLQHQHQHQHQQHQQPTTSLPVEYAGRVYPSSLLPTSPFAPTPAAPSSPLVSRLPTSGTSYPATRTHIHTHSQQINDSLVAELSALNQNIRQLEERRESLKAQVVSSMDRSERGSDYLQRCMAQNERLASAVNKAQSFRPLPDMKSVSSEEQMLESRVLSSFSQELDSKYREIERAKEALRKLTSDREASSHQLVQHTNHIEQLEKEIRELMTQHQHATQAGGNNNAMIERVEPVNQKKRMVGDAVTDAVKQKEQLMQHHLSELDVLIRLLSSCCQVKAEQRRRLEKFGSQLTLGGPSSVLDMESACQALNFLLDVRGRLRECESEENIRTKNLQDASRRVEELRGQLREAEFEEEKAIAGVDGIKQEVWSWRYVDQSASKALQLPNGVSAEDVQAMIQHGQERQRYYERLRAEMSKLDGEIGEAKDELNACQSERERLHWQESRRRDIMSHLKDFTTLKQQWDRKRELVRQLEANVASSRETMRVMEEDRDAALASGDFDDFKRYESSARQLQSELGAVEDDRNNHVQDFMATSKKLEVIMDAVDDLGDDATELLVASNIPLHVYRSHKRKVLQGKGNKHHFAFTPSSSRTPAAFQHQQHTGTSHHRSHPNTPSSGSYRSMSGRR